MKRLALVLALLVVGAFGACRLLPERYAVNAPLGALLFGRPGPPADAATLDARIRVPEGFSISVFAREMPGVRFLRFTESGDLLASQPRSGRVLLVRADADGDGASDGRDVLLDGLDRPHGLDLHDGWLYVGETGAVARVRFDDAARAVSGTPERISALPAGGNHWTRTVRIGPDGWLYVSIGSDCNVCIEEDPRRAALVRYRPDGSGEEIFARGLRNAVGFDWQPGSGALYATDNGRDLLGDDFPPCELNRVERGAHYGWPFVNGFGVADPDYGDHPDAPARTTPPVHGFRAHNAPLGITFVRGADAPPAYRNAALVALHGSWNRSRKSGYKVMSVHWGPDGAISTRDFLWGFEEGEDVIGRPVSVAEGIDGAIYVSDDYTGTIYRVVWVGKGKQVMRPAATPTETGAMAVPDPLAGLSDAERKRLMQRGSEIYAAMGCVNCHGLQGTGRSAPALAGLARRFGIADLVALFEKPPANMPPARLSGEEGRALAVYLLDVNG